MPRPVRGSATADTSTTLRFAHPRSRCHAGLLSNFEQPLPAPGQAFSVQPRAFFACCREVPPTAVTYGEDAGHWTPYPASPDAAVIVTPRRLKCASARRI